MPKRDDDYWHRAPYRLHLPDREPPSPWYERVPWWIWPFSTAVILSAIGAAFYMARELGLL